MSKLCDHVKSTVLSQRIAKSFTSYSEPAFAVIAVAPKVNSAFVKGVSYNAGTLSCGYITMLAELFQAEQVIVQAAGGLTRPNMLL